MSNNITQNSDNPSKKATKPSSNQSLFPYTFKSDQNEEINDNVVVLKIGSSSLSNADGTIRLSIMSQFVEIVHQLIQKGYKVAIVSSGAVSVGCSRLNLKERPKDTISKQAYAAVGQSRLVRLYDELFSIFNIPVAQVLLTRDNVGHEDHYLNSVNTMRRLIELGIVAIINENDTVSVFKSKVGDNDTLAGMVASMIKAKWLVLITDVDALYTANPHTDPTAQPIRVVKDIPALMENTSMDSATTSSSTPTAVKSGAWGTGGIQTKVTAALMASHAGVTTGIVSSNHFNHILQMIDGDRNVGTVFLPSKTALSGRKKWIAIANVPSGSIVIDDGAARAVHQSNSLFASGIVSVKGDFERNARVSIYTTSMADMDSIDGATGADDADKTMLDEIPLSKSLSSSSSKRSSVNAAAASPDCDEDSSSSSGGGVYAPKLIEIGRGLVNFSSDELQLIKGKQSSEIPSVLMNYYQKLQSMHNITSTTSSTTATNEFMTSMDISSIPSHLTLLGDLGCVINRENLAIYDKTKP